MRFGWDSYEITQVINIVTQNLVNLFCGQVEQVLFKNSFAFKFLKFKHVNFF